MGRGGSYDQGAEAQGEGYSEIKNQKLVIFLKCVTRGVWAL